MIDQEGSLGVGAGSVWAVTQGTENRYEQTLSRFDAATGETEARIALPAGGAGVIASDGFIWVTSPHTGQIFKVAPETATVAATLDVGGSPRFIAAGEGALWVVDQSDATVLRIDPESGSVVARIATGESGGPGGYIDAGGGFVWVAWAHRSTGTQIDPAANALAARFANSLPITSMRYGGGSV
jgi:DNA-binding beta-propeller fold protein YncE